MSILRTNLHQLFSYSWLFAEFETCAKLRLMVFLFSHRENFVPVLRHVLTHKWINVDTRVWHRRRGDILSTLENEECYENTDKQPCRLCNNCWQSCDFKVTAAAELRRAEESDERG